MSKKAALLLIAASSSAALLVPGCSSNDDPYKPVPAYSGGKKANLPSIPSLPNNPIKQGDAFTVFGAIHHLNSVLHNPEVTAKEISLVGYIVDMNTARAPTCAIHKAGKADPEDCKWSDGKPIQIPTIWIADGKTDEKPRIRVMGWASNYANIFEANEKYKNLKEAPAEKDQYKDELWAMAPPFPLPNVGAKIKVTGKYGVNFQRASAGIEADPANGIMTYTKIEYLEPPPTPFTFPQGDNSKDPPPKKK
jgi:hypothetical protein